MFEPKIPFSGGPGKIEPARVMQPAPEFLRSSDDVIDGIVTEDAE
jgi:hypothetical protein